MCQKCVKNVQIASRENSKPDIRAKGRTLMVSDWPPCANDCCETSNHDVPDANDNSTQMHGETSNLDGIRCKAFDFLRESLESQLNQRGGVVLRWEQRENCFHVLRQGHLGLTVFCFTKVPYGKSGGTYF